MRETEAGRIRAPWRANPILSRLASAGAHLSGALLLAGGVANTLAARRNRGNGDKHDANGGKNHERDRDREHRQDRERDATREERHARRDEREDRDRKDRDVEREQTDDANKDRNRNRNDDGSSDDTNSDVGTEQNRNNGGRDDEPNNNDGSGDGGGNNAGSALFDNSLATKARRRARDFEGNDRNDEDDDGIVVDEDPEGDSVYQTDSISYTTGPDGIEILTRNITYTAVPTPTPTPFPRLEFPERDGHPFGEDFPFGVARPTATPGAAPTDSGDVSPDTGDVPPPVAPVPTTPPSDGTDGGDNSTDFSS